MHAGSVSSFRGYSVHTSVGCKFESAGQPLVFEWCYSDFCSSFASEMSTFNASRAGSDVLSKLDI